MLHPQSSNLAPYLSADRCPTYNRTAMMTPADQHLQPLLDAFVRGCLDAFGAQRVDAIVLHGSAAKGGFIVGFSDVDFVVLLSPECFDEFGLRLDLAFAIQERIAAIPWRNAGASYPQAYFYDAAQMPAWWTGPDAAASRVLHGHFPDELRPTPNRLRAAALRLLREDLPGLIHADVESFADSADEQLPRRLRLLATRVTPSMFSLLTLRSDDPLGEWARPKHAAAERLAAAYPGVAEAALPGQFYRNVSGLLGEQFDVGLARRTYRLGLDFLIWAHRTAIAAVDA